MKPVLAAILVLILAGLGVLTATWQAPRTEAEVKENVTRALAREGLQFAGVSVDGREVTLSGPAPTPAARQAAETVAQNAEGVRTVTNRMGVLPPPGDPVAECQSAIRRLLEPDPIQFRTGSAEIDAGSVPLLTRILSILEGCPEATIQLGGYTDNVGSAASNLRLSQARAESVRAYLTERGVAPERLTAIGFGDAKPVATNDTEAGRRKNRRIEFILWKESP